VVLRWRFSGEAALLSKEYMMRWTLSRWLPVMAFSAFFAFAGCGAVPSIPSIDEVQNVPDSSQAIILDQDRFQPPSGPIGTILTIQGQGTIFPAGLVHVQFTGNAALDFDQPVATSQLRFRVPLGAQSGPFGFYIAARSSQVINNALPSSDLFQAWRFAAPGFLVEDPNTTPPDVLVPPPNKHQPRPL
jgi:hypothetical protein